MVAETTEIHHLTVLEDASPRSKCMQSWFLPRPVSLALDGRLLALCARGAWVPLSASGYIRFPLFIKTPVTLD